jgi:oligoendopeptidase F
MTALNHKYVSARELFPLDAKRYQVYDRAIKTDIELFVEKNVPLQTKVDLLSQEYQTVCGAMTVMFDGKEHTMPQMGKYLLETDRSLRERAWRASAERRIKDKDKWKNF